MWDIAAADNSKALAFSTNNLVKTYLKFMSPKKPSVSFKHGDGVIGSEISTATERLKKKSLYAGFVGV